MKCLLTFGTAWLGVVGCVCRAATDQLPGNVPTEPSIRKRVDDLAHPRGEGNQSLRQSPPFAQRAVC